MSTFLHEQLHWYEVSHFERISQVINELKGFYSNVPVGYPAGAKDEFSTYLHMIIKFLEVKALNELLVKEEVDTVIDFLINDHYTWIYKTVLNDFNSLEHLLGKYEILL